MLMYNLSFNTHQGKYFSDITLLGVLVLSGMLRFFKYVLASSLSWHTVAVFHLTSTEVSAT